MFCKISSANMQNFEETIYYKNFFNMLLFFQPRYFVLILKIALCVKRFLKYPH